MSLFDGTSERPRERKAKATKNVLKAKHRSNDESLLDPRYGVGSRSATHTTAANRTRNERRELTEAYERGEIKFNDTSSSFMLCYCNMAPDYHDFPHEPHKEEIAKFELQHYGKKR